MSDARSFVKIKNISRGGAVVACRAHNPKVAGSSPAPATKKTPNHPKITERKSQGRRFDKGAFALPVAGRANETSGKNAVPPHPKKLLTIQKLERRRRRVGFLTKEHLRCQWQGEQMRRAAKTRCPRYQKKALNQPKIREKLSQGRRFDKGEFALPVAGRANETSGKNAVPPHPKKLLTIQKLERRRRRVGVLTKANLRCQWQGEQMRRAAKTRCPRTQKNS